ncbi:Uncharacterized protein TPAR_06262 [Tolypocladium paradoxum]|uniref:Methyltransferase n=1 Tax=Tolypocladium paradoxum TaxID=94208 RepID=A0A2S4KTQ7_9HYPO|nr:Uncharacterized protein TPAR_06262 [Tolypocladium paradoxum]
MDSVNPTDREASLQYIRPDSKVNRRYMAAGKEVSTGKYETKKVLVRDGRPELDKFKLDTTGFQLIKHTSSVREWSNLDELDSVYDIEIHDMIKHLTGADKVIVFGTVRRTTHDKPAINESNKWDDQPPASDVHVDYTPRRAESLAVDFAKRNGLDRSEYKRVQFINIWRAVSPGPQNWPLAVCRGDKLGDEEGVVNHLIYGDTIPDLNNLPELPEDPLHPEGHLFPYRPSHHWTYFSNMAKDEVLLFTLYDSNQKKPWRVPHTSFHNDMEGTKPRESVEIRTVCFFK